MAGDLKARRGQRLEAGEAASQLEHLAARFAVEMMVVSLAGKFVTGRFSRQFDRRQPALVHESFDITVNRGNADALLIGRGELQHFVRVQWTVRQGKRLADRPALTSIAVLGWIGRGH